MTITSVYHETHTEEKPMPHYRGVSYRKPIDAAKETIPTLQLARDLCGEGELRQIGERHVGHCPLPDHDDKSPSFNVYAETNSFFCFGCLRGGDVVRLYMLANDHDPVEAGTAAGFLLLEYGHEPPQRPESWFRKQERQKPIRDGIEDLKKKRWQRRLFKAYSEPYLQRIEDPDEREREARAEWRNVGEIARAAAKGAR